MGSKETALEQIVVIQAWEWSESRMKEKEVEEEKGVGPKYMKSTDLA